MSEDRRRNLIQVLLSETEHSLLREAALRSGVKLAQQARALLVVWAKTALDARGATRGGVCGSTTGCTNENALWFNRAGKFFVCESCATSLNQTTPWLCSKEDGPVGALPEDEVVALREKVWPAQREQRVNRQKLERKLESLRAQLVETARSIDEVVGAPTGLPPEIAELVGRPSEN